MLFLQGTVKLLMLMSFWLRWICSFNFLFYRYNLKISCFFWTTSSISNYFYSFKSLIFKVSLYNFCFVLKFYSSIFLAIKSTYSILFCKSRRSKFRILLDLLSSWFNTIIMLFILVSIVFIFSLYLFSTKLEVALFMSSKFSNILSNTFIIYAFFDYSSFLSILLNTSKFFFNTLWNYFYLWTFRVCNIDTFYYISSRFSLYSFTILYKSFTIFLYFFSYSSCCKKWNPSVLVLAFIVIGSS